MEKNIETKEVQGLRSEASGLLEMAESLTVTAKTVGDASDILSWIATSKKKLEGQRVGLVKPLNDHVKFINNQFKDWMAPLNDADSAVRSKMLTYQQEQNRIAAEARAVEEERIRAERAEQERLTAEAEESGEPIQPIQPPMPAPDVPAMPDRTTRSTLGTTTVRKIWTFEITNESAIPREYLVADEKKIRAVVKAGIRNIDGVRVFEIDQLSVRSKG